MPIMTVRSLVLGMAAMNVLNGVILLLLLCALPLLLLAAAGFQHSSVFKLHTFFVVLLVVGISFGFNASVIGMWCFRGLFGSINKRIMVTIPLFLWHLLLVWSMIGDYLDIGLVLAVLCFAIWDKRYKSQEQN